MTDVTLDILMITYNRPHYTRLALPRLLETCDETMRVWLWHNGDDAATLDVVRAHLDHPRLHRFRHSPRNVRLTAPTNWLWEHGDGAFVGKLDDDCLVPDAWAQRLRDAHLRAPRLGALSAWWFDRDDWDEERGPEKVVELPGGVPVVKHPYIGGGAYVMKRACIDDLGLLRDGQSFPSYCTSLAWRGWINGWHYPLIHVDHMDDPRSPHTILRTDADVRAHTKPLTASKVGCDSLAEWQRILTDCAERVQATPTDPCRFFAARSLPLRAWSGAKRTFRKAAA